MPRANTQAEISEARDYLLSELSAKEQMSHYLEEALIKAATEIVRISFEYQIPPKEFRFSSNPRLKERVRNVLALLREMLYKEELRHLRFKTDSGEYTPEILTKKNYGKTLKERIALYVGRYEYEIEAIVAACLLSGERSIDRIIQSVKDNLYSPYENNYYLNQKGDGKANRLHRDKVSYGVGKTTSAAYGLLVALSYVLVRGYNDNWFRMGKARGAIGFWTFRNSSFPCEVCDEQSMVFHYMTDEMPPFHPNCVCGMAFVYGND